MTVEKVAQQHYRRSSLTTRQVVAAVLELWRATGPSGFRDELVRAAGLVAAGQLAAARQGADYVAAAAVAQGVPVGGVPDVVARAFAGQTADGMPLEQVLRAPLTRVRAMQAAGATADEAVRSGTATLTRLVSNEVTLAGNNATAVAVTANPGLDGYVRMLSRPSCGRCAILAGKWFKWNAGFDRHPGCDCVHVPAADAASVDGLAANPRAYFDSLSKADQDRYFGKAEAEAIRGGADMGRTVNATGSSKSGLASGSFSTKPTGGVGRALRSAEDLDRDRATALLRDRGYLTQSSTTSVPDVFNARPPAESLPDSWITATEQAGRRKFGEDFYIWDSPQMEAVDAYMGEDFHYINRYLRTGKVESGSPWDESEMADIVSHIDDAYDTVPTATRADTQVLRGWSDRGTDFKPGSIIEDRGFVSTTTDRGVAQEFSGRVVAIRVRKGTKVLNVTGGSEAEIVLKRGTRFRVIGNEVIDGVDTIVVEAMP